jgi:hypothetical protein
VWGPRREWTLLEIEQQITPPITAADHADSADSADKASSRTEEQEVLSSLLLRSELL